MALRNKIIAIVGMTGSGKSEVARIFERRGYKRIRFGDVTDEEVKKRGLPLNEQNEKLVREELRRELGMAAYAILNMPRIDKALESASVVIDGLYSWDEYKVLKERYGDRFSTLAVWASPATRYRRLSQREVRPLTPLEAASRDQAEIENSAKGGPIAMADWTVTNEGTLTALKRQVNRILKDLNGKNHTSGDR